MTLTVQSLACSRGGVSILEGVDFTLEPGQVLLLRGPNGIGKTTLLRTLAGLQPAHAGSVSVATDQMAYAGHADGLKPTLTVTENLSFWADIYGGGGVADALAAFDLTALATRQAQNLSAGQKRRLGLARLLVTHRPIWLLDEPTVSLDRASVGLFEGAVARHCANGGSAVIATHIDLNIGADTLDLSQFRPDFSGTPAFDEAFL
ncbi:heme ABC exporter ATP-binding protein CcmA [Aliiroseovarius sp. YM-037]|uniref:heme ABC exporter ATP-binding protein CcmA n=1 Tax=Aliiroseovarius sp. YM-037 TaxID=3341728 RepID=UPI003A80F5CC